MTPRLAFAPLLLAAAAAPARAQQRLDDSDAALARRPVIVVARWAGSRDDFVDAYRLNRRDVRTTLLVDRVLSGDATPGKLEVRFDDDVRLVFDQLGRDTQTVGEAQDVSALNLWFFSMETRTERKQTRTYGRIDTCRAAQPLVLEPYFRALRSATPDEEVGELLAGASEDVVEKALIYVAGARPWPFARAGKFGAGGPPESFSGARANLLPRVEAHFARPSAPHRVLAAAVLAQVPGREHPERARALLADSDPEVRDVAIGVLAGWRDFASMPAMAEAARRPHAGRVARDTLERLVEWKASAVVPLLFGYLESESDDGAENAFDAQAALREQVGYWFPTDVEASWKAWKAAEAIADRTAQVAKLRELLGDDVCPFTARFVSEVGAPRRCSVVVKNVSGRALRLAREPSSIQFRGKEGEPIIGQFFRPYDRPASESAFVALAPQEETRFQADLPDWFVPSRSTERRITLGYRCAGLAYGVHAWTGEVAFALP